MIEFFVIVVALMGFGIASKPCMFNLADHKWIGKGEFQHCSRCGIVIKRVKK